MFKKFLLDSKEIDAHTRIQAKNELEGSFKFHDKRVDVSNDQPIQRKVCSDEYKTTQIVPIHKTERDICRFWTGDVAIWKIESEGLTSAEQQSVAKSLNRSVASIQTRLYELRRISQSVSISVQSSLSLADPEIIHIWREFRKHNVYIRGKTVQFLAQSLNRNVEELNKLLHQIRNLKHYLHFVGIHEEDGDAEAATLPRPSESSSHSTIATNYTDEAVPLELKPRLRHDYSPEEVVLIYDSRVKDPANMTSCKNLAEQMGRNAKSVTKKKLRISNCMQDAELALDEGITLMWGADTQLWSEYIDVLSTGYMLASPIPIVQVKVDIVAEGRTSTARQVKWRLQLIRSLKRFLHIAGIHNDSPNSSDSHAASSKVSSTSSNSITADSSTRGVEASMFANRVLDAEARISERVAVEAAMSDLVSSTEARVAKALQADRAVVQSVMSDLVHSTEIRVTDRSTVESVLGELLTYLEIVAEVKSLVQSLCEVVHQVSSSSVAPVAVGGVKHRSSHSAAGQPYSEEEDHCIWSAWVQLSPLEQADKTERKKFELSLARQLNRTNRGIEKRLTQLQDLAHEAEEVVGGGVTLLPGESLDRWTHYCQLVPPLTCNNLYIDTKVVVSLAKEWKISHADLHADFYEFRVLKRFLRISGVHQGQANSPGATSTTETTAGAGGRSTTADESKVAEKPPVDRSRSLKSPEGDARDTATVSPTSTTATVTVPPFPPSQGNLNDLSSKEILLAVNARLAAVEIAAVSEVLHAVVEEVERAALTHAAVLEVVREIVSEVATTYTLLQRQTEQVDAKRAAKLNDPLTPAHATALLPSTGLPFACSREQEGLIWSVYVRHQHNPTKTLPVRLTKLARRLGCTFIQIREHLSALMSLQLGLTAQPHSVGRPFSATENSEIEAALISATPITYAVTLMVVAQRLRCAVGAVAGRHRQLKTLRLLTDVSNATQQAWNQHRAVTTTTTTSKRLKRSGDFAGEEQTKRHKSGNEACYFSTEGESDNDDENTRENVV